MNERDKKGEDEGRGPNPAAAKTAVEPPKRQVPLLGLGGDDSLSADPWPLFPFSSLPTEGWEKVQLP